MKTALAIAGNDGRRRMKAPGGMILLIFVPLMMCGLIGIIFSPGKNILPKISLLVVDEDNGMISRFMIQAFTANESRRMFDIRPTDRRRGLASIAAGKASALLIIPPSFSADVLAGRPRQVDLFRNPSQVYLPAIAEEYVRSISIALSALVWVFFDEIQSMKSFFDLSASTLSTAEILPFLERARVKMAVVRRVISPLLIALKKEEIQEKKKISELTVFSYIFPGMAVLFLFFIIQSMMEDLLREKEKGTLRRILCSPVASSQYVLGKIAGAFLIGIVAYGLMVGFAIPLFKLPLTRWPFHLLLSLAVSFFAASFFAMIFAFVRNRNQASAVTTPIILIFGMTGGSMIPLDQLSGGFRAISRFTPNYWFITGSHKLFSGSFPLASIVILTLTGAVSFLVAFIFLRRRMERG